MSEIKGRVWKFGDNIPTGQIVRADRTSDDMEEMMRHVLEDYNPEFPKRARKGDISVAEKRFGQPSGRTAAPKVTKTTGAGAVVIEHASRLFYGNTFEVELPPVECPGITDHASDGNRLSVDVTAGKIKDKAIGDVLQAHPVDPFSMEMLEARGLVAFGPRIDQWNV